MGRVYAQRQKLGADIIAHASGIRFDALRKLGLILSETPKNTGMKGSVVTGTERVPVKDDTPTLADLGMLDNTISPRYACLQMSKMIDAATAAGKLGVNLQRMRFLCRARRIRGARLVGRVWMIPDDFVVTPGARGPALGAKK